MSQRTLILILLTLYAINSTNAGILKYKVNNNHVIVTHCDQLAKGNIVIPDHLDGLPVTEIADNAFINCNYIETLEIGKNIKFIGVSAIRYCQTLSSVKISNSVRNISEWAFADCPSLVDVEFGNGLTDIGIAAFRNCTALKEIKFSNSIENIKGWAFAGCSDLETVIFGEELKQLEEAAFRHCVKLKEVIFKDNIESIYGWAFHGCITLQKVNFPTNCKLSYLGPAAFLECKNLLNFRFPENVDAILASTFMGCEKLNKLYLGKEIKNIEQDNLDNLTKLENLSINPENKFYKVIDDVLYNSNIDEIIYFPKSKKGIYKLPANISKIGSFLKATQLSEIIVSDSVTTIPRNAFAKSPELKKVTLGVNINRVLDYAFADCKNLISLEFRGAIPKIKKSLFDGTNIKTIYVTRDFNKYKVFFSENEVLLLSGNEVKIIEIANAPFGFSFNTEEGTSYEVQASDDLRKWGQLREVKGTGEVVKFEDFRKAFYQQQYYRVLVK